MNKKTYKKGDVIDTMTTAGQDMEQWSKYGITVDVFKSKRLIEIPTIVSENPGSGMLPAFLRELKTEANGVKIVFNTVINQSLIKHLRFNDIEFN